MVSSSKAAKPFSSTSWKGLVQTLRNYSQVHSEVVLVLEHISTFNLADLRDAVLTAQKRLHEELGQQLVEHWAPQIRTELTEEEEA